MKTSRNDPCPCKSGKKFKHCCINKPVNNVIPIRAPLANPFDAENQNLSFSSLMDDDWMEDMDDEDLMEDEWMADWLEGEWDEDDWEFDIDEEYEEELMDRFFESLASGREPDKELQEEIEDYLEENPDFIFEILGIMHDLRSKALSQHAHIKAYNKARNLHEEILNSMLRFYEKGGFIRELEMSSGGEKFSDITELEERVFLESNFDFDEIPQQKAFMDLMIYKHLPQMNCITEEFIKQKRYKKAEKIQFLESMRDSYLGLFQVLSVDGADAYVDLRNVFTNEEIRIIDIGLSGDNTCERVYIYTRIIDFQGILFSTGLNFFFNAEDSFIQKFIKREKRKYNQKDEFKRFFQLYNQFKVSYAEEEGVDGMGIEGFSEEEIDPKEANSEEMSIKEGYSHKVNVGNEAPTENNIDQMMRVVNYREEKLFTTKKEATLEEWRQLYEVATRLKELKPWELFWDMDLVRVKEEGDVHEAYASILGKGEGCYGIVMYEGLSGLNSFLMLAMQERLNLSPEFAMLSQNALTCYWGNRDELKEKERKIIKELGYKYRGKDQWLYFRAYNDAFYPDSFDQSEVLRMTHYFTLLEKAIKFYVLKDINVDFQSGGCYSFNYNKKNESFSAGEEPLALTMFQIGDIHIVDEDLIHDLKQAKRSNQILDVEVTFLGAGVKEDETGRLMNPKLCLVADSNTGLMIATDMLDARDEVATCLASGLVDFILSNGAPKEVRVTNVIVESYVKNVCEICGIKLRRVKRLPNIEDFVEGLKRFQR